MKRKMINWLGLTGLAALISYIAAMIFSPLAFPGYNWMEQAVSDLSAYSAPSKQLWDRISAVYGTCSVVCATCIAIFVSENRIFSKLFRIGIYLFTAMNWVSKIGYGMFALSDAGKEISGSSEIMHMIVTVLVVLLSIASLGVLFPRSISAYSKGSARSRQWDTMRSSAFIFSMDFRLDQMFFRSGNIKRPIT